MAKTKRVFAMLSKICKNLILRKCKTLITPAHGQIFIVFELVMIVTLNDLSQIQSKSEELQLLPSRTHTYRLTYIDVAMH